MFTFFVLTLARVCRPQVAMTWSEVWHEGLEEASRMYFGDGNIEGMLDRLQVCCVRRFLVVIGGLEGCRATALLRGEP